MASPHESCSFSRQVIILAGLANRFTGGDELTATVLATPSPTPLTAAFDETVEIREIALPAEVWYCLQSGIFSSEAAAQEKSLAYSDRGAPGFVSPEGGKFRVLLSAYASREDAQRVKEKLAGQQSVETYIYEMVRPALHLQLTGMRGQLDVLDAAAALLPELAQAWRETALTLDQGQTSLTEVQELAAEQQEQCHVMLNVLQERFLSPMPTLAQQLQALLTQAEASARRVQDAVGQGRTAASAQLKMEALAGHQALKDVWETILSRIIFADCRRGMKHKMTLRDIARLLDAEVLTGEDKLDTEAVTACGSDLMSDVLAFVKDKTILITGLVNAHVIRTAEMLDIICVVFARGKRPSEDILEQAREIDLPVLATKLTTYTACGELYLHGLPGTKEAGT